MSGNIVVALLETFVLLDKVEVISSNNDGSGHLGGRNDTSQDGTSNGNVASERALFVDVFSFNGSFWGFKSQTNIFVVSLLEDSFLLQ